MIMGVAIILWITFIVFIFFAIIYGLYDSISMNNYCKIVYPAVDKGNSFENFQDIEPGYIGCCRSYFTTEHIREEECEVFKKP